MTTIRIEDSRKIQEFRNISFSYYKKSDVKKELCKSIVSGKIEDSCYWSAELICAGHFMYLWEIIFTVIAKIYILGILNYQYILNYG